MDFTYTQDDLESKLTKYRENSRCLADIMMHNFADIHKDVINGMGILPIHNLFQNQDVLVGFPQLQDMTAIVVGAGPSLDNILAELCESQGKFFIVASDASLPVLMKHNIKPHVVVVCDHSNRQAGNFRGLDLSDIIVATASCIDFSTLEEIKASKARILWYNMYGEDTIPTAIVKIAGKKGALLPAVLTTGMAYQLAIWAGIKRVGFIGMDLCYPSFNQGYAKDIDNNKSDFQKNTKFKKSLSFIPDMHGHPVLACDSFIAFHSWINMDEKDWPWAGVATYNCSGQGILYGDRITQITFADFIENFGIDDISRKSKSILEQRLDAEEIASDFIIGQVT